MAQGEIELIPWEPAGPVAHAFELSRAPVAMIVGPTGGGKSTASARRCLRIATWQDPSPRDGVRRARIVVICPTYRRAWDQVIPTYGKVFPQKKGEFLGSRGDPADHVFNRDVMLRGERATCHVEILFRAVNDLDIEVFFRGYEFTAIHLPEADTNGDLAQIISLGSNRVGRYPEPDDRPDHSELASYSGIFGDANAPIIGTAFHDRFYLKKTADGARAPESDRVYLQPGGRSANAENMKNLRKIRRDYYEHMASQQDEYDNRRMIDNKPGFGRHGQPVQPNFDSDTHVAKVPLQVDPMLPVYIGVDCGSNALVPGAVFYQRSYMGQWRALAEIFLAEGNMNTAELAHAIRETFHRRFAQLLSARALAVQREERAQLCLDPAAGGAQAASEFTTAQDLQAQTHIEVALAPTNNPRHRRSALDRLFKRMVGPREPAFIADPEHCPGFIAGLAGGFHYQKRGAIVGLAPVKNRYSHVCEAGEYAPLTIDGVDPEEGRLIRPDGADAYSGPSVIY